MEMQQIFELVRAWMDENSGNGELVKEFREGIREAMKMEKGDGRKEQVKALLMERGKMSIAELAEALETSTKNISSQLSYLRKDGVKIATSSDGRKFIED